MKNKEKTEIIFKIGERIGKLSGIFLKRNRNIIVIPADNSESKSQASK